MGPVRNIINILIVGFILFLLYLFLGQGSTEFNSGGKKEILESGARINELCNTNGSCPTTLEGWEKWGSGVELSKGNMLYFVTPTEEGEGKDKIKKFQEFRLVYRFFMPDKWFEVQGGVGKKVTSGWKNR
jgi:hypothetical protein